MKPIFALIIAILLMTSSLQSMKTLSDFRWINRILIVDARNPHSLNKLEGELVSMKNEVQERRLITIVVLPDALKVYGSTFETKNSELRRQQLVQALENTQAILIGLDGGVKARYSANTFSLGEVLNDIDTMPMRRAEMQQQ